MRTLLSAVMLLLLSISAMAQDDLPLPSAPILIPLPEEITDCGTGWRYPWDLIGETRAQWRAVPSPGDAIFGFKMEVENMTDEEFAESWPTLKQLFVNVLGKDNLPTTRAELIARLDEADQSMESSSAREFMRQMPDPSRPTSTLTDSMVILSAVYRPESLAKQVAHIDLPAKERDLAANQIRDQKADEKKLRETQAAQMLKDYEELEEEYALYVRGYEASKTDGSSEQTIKEMEGRMKAARGRADWTLKQIEAALTYSPEVTCEGIDGVDSGYLLAIDEKGDPRVVTVKARIRVGRAMLDVSRHAQGAYANNAAAETKALLKRLSVDLAPFTTR